MKSSFSSRLSYFVRVPLTTCFPPLTQHYVAPICLLTFSTIALLHEFLCDSGSDDRWGSSFFIFHSGCVFLNYLLPGFFVISVSMTFTQWIRSPGDHGNVFIPPFSFFFFSFCSKDSEGPPIASGGSHESTSVFYALIHKIPQKTLMSDIYPFPYSCAE